MTREIGWLLSQRLLPFAVGMTLGLGALMTPQMIQRLLSIFRSRRPLGKSRGTSAITSYRWLIGSPAEKASGIDREAKARSTTALTSSFTDSPEKGGSNVVPRCTHPQIEYMVIGQMVFVKCVSCNVRGRLFMVGDGNNTFTSLTVQIALEGYNSTGWLALKCAHDGCEHYALRGDTHCREHQQQKTES